MEVTMKGEALDNANTEQDTQLQQVNENFSDHNAIWVTWEEHRRTRELARVFGAELHEMLFAGPYFLRVFVLAWRTLALLMKTRPAILFVQNPSVVLASWACLLRPFFGYYLIVDRHSNFKLHKLDSKELKYRVFYKFSGHSLRHADLTIVTNEPLVELLEEMGGRGFVMPDRFPELPLAEKRDLGPGKHALYICSFDDDEPVSEVMDAARLLGSGVTLHVTGKFSKAAPGVVDTAPDNVNFTGFISEEEYQSLLASVDTVLTLTTMPHTMQCGAYEAVTASRPLVFGPDKAMVQYFDKGCVVTELKAASIAKSIEQALNDCENLMAESKLLHRERSAWWNNNLKEFFGLVLNKIKSV